MNPNPTRFSSEAEYRTAVKRLEELKANPSSSNQDETRKLAESIEAYRRDNPNVDKQGGETQQSGQYGYQGNKPVRQGGGQSGQQGGQSGAGAGS